jgi:hypothetical protein
VDVEVISKDSVLLKVTMFHWVHDSLHSEDCVFFFYKGNKFVKNGCYGFIALEDDGNMFFQNTVKDLPNDTPSHPGTLELTSTPVCKLYVGEDCGLLGCCSLAYRYQHLGGGSFLQNVGTDWQNCRSQPRKP